MTSKTKLTTADLEAALNDERHLGFGYATRDYLPTSLRERLDRNVVWVANDLGLDAETLFHWANSKNARWLCDHASDGKVSRDRVRDYLNPETVASAMDF